MKNVNIYKKTCLAIALASSLTLSGCGKDEVSIVNRVNSTTVEIAGDNNKVSINGNDIKQVNNLISVNEVTITGDKDKLNIKVEDETISVDVDAYNLDNIVIEIKDNEVDGSLVFIKNIFSYIVEDGNYEYGIILDIPEDKKTRKTNVYSYTYEVKDNDKAIYTIYEIDGNGNKVLLETHIIDKSAKLGLSK